MKYAVIDGGIVINIIEADAKFVVALTGHDSVVEAGDAGIGWLWDGKQLSAPAPGPQAQETPEPRHITVLAFRDRFTEDEQTMMEFLLLDDPAADIGVRMLSAKLRARDKKSLAATYIDLDRQDTRAGVAALEGFGLLAPGRTLEILDAPVRQEERAK